MALLNTIDKLPKTSAEAFRVFDERYLAGVSAMQPDTWVEELGDVFDVDSPDTTFPIGLLTAKYEETKGNSRARTMEEGEIRLKTAEYDAGYEAKLIDLTTKTFAYRKWATTPRRFLSAEKRLILQKIAGLLEANPVCPWDALTDDSVTTAFFHATDHVANPADPDGVTFGNYDASGLDPADIANIQAQVAAMMEVPDENGDRLEVYPTHIGLPTEKFEAVKNKLGQEFIIEVAGDGATNNPYKGVIRPVHMPQLTDANDWYLIDMNTIQNQAVPPWIAIRYMAAAALGMRRWDESSDFFKDSSKIKVSSHIWYGFSLAFPHAIRKVAGA